MVVDKHKLLMVHVPKCGGTTIEMAFQNVWGVHNKVSDYKKMKKYKWKEFFTFAYIRNPWDWYLSLHRYWSNMSKTKWFTDIPKEREAKEKWYKENIKNFPDAINKIQFLMESEETGPHFEPQSSFVMFKGEVGVDFLGRFENYLNDWEKIKKIKGLNVELGHYNKLGKGIHYSAFYSDEMAEKVGEFYKCDVENFGYEFERVEDYHIHI